jgi:hypothetical protein
MQTKNHIIIYNKDSNIDSSNTELSVNIPYLLYKIICVINYVLFHDNIENVIDYKLIYNYEIYFKNMIFVTYHNEISISLTGEIIELVKQSNVIFRLIYKNHFSFIIRKLW